MRDRSSPDPGGVHRGLLAALGLEPPKSWPASAAADAAGAQRGLDALVQSVAALAPRLARAADPKAASGTRFIADRQATVQSLHAALAQRIGARDLAGAEAVQAQLVAALGHFESDRQLLATHLKKREAAQAGAVKTALRLSLVPQALATSRTRALEQREAEIGKLADGGRIVEANRAVDAWVREAQAWTKSKDAYEALRAKQPKAGELKDLLDVPGGARVLDALVADLPDDAPQSSLMAALKARYEVEVERDGGPGGKGRGADSTTAKADPKTPEKALKGLYRVLGKVPLDDSGQPGAIERMSDATDAGAGAPAGTGALGATVQMYCGRPDAAAMQEFGKPGEVVAPGDEVDPDVAPVDTAQPVASLDFAALHEVGLALADDTGVMGNGRAADAGWQQPALAEVARIAAAKHRYDAGYIGGTLKSETNEPPAEPPGPPAGRKPAEWEQCRKAALAWCAGVRVGAAPWLDAGRSKALAIDGRVYHEAEAGRWVSYLYSARAQGITGAQFRSPADWFAELYAAYHSGKLNPRHPAAGWLGALAAGAEARP